MSRPYDVMIAGHLCLDIIPRFPDGERLRIDQIIHPGKLVNVGDAKISTGGPVSNTGINMKTLGNSVCFCACVGDDEFGQLTINMLKKNGNADGIHLIRNIASSYTIVLAPPHIDRIFLHNPGTNNRFVSDDLDSALISRCKHFHFGYPPLMSGMFTNSGLELEKVFKIAKNAGATTSCDMTLPDPSSLSGKAPWREILKRILPYIDIYLPSIEETFYMLYPDKFLKMKALHNNAELIDYMLPQDYSALADELIGMGSKMVALKSGHRGFYLKTANKSKFDDMGAARPADYDNWSNRELWAPAFYVEKFGSATGSGDSSIAGLLSAFLRGLTIEESLKYATCLGWQNVQVLDAVSGIRPWQETTDLINLKMPLIDAKIDATGWKWSKQYNVWSVPTDPLDSK